MLREEISRIQDFHTNQSRNINEHQHTKIRK